MPLFIRLYAVIALILMAISAFVVMVIICGLVLGLQYLIGLLP